MSAADAPMIRGERVVLVDGDNEWRHQVAASEVYTVNGRPYVDVLSEGDWWERRLLRKDVSGFLRRWPAELVWLE